MTHFLPSPVEARAALAPLVREPVDDERAMHLLARHAWSCLVEPGDGLAKGLELAKRIATNSPTTNFAVMHALPRIAEQDRASGYLMESMMAAIAQGNDEAKKRITAFLEKRAAKVTRK